MKKPIVIGIVGLLLAAAAYVWQGGAEGDLASDTARTGSLATSGSVAPATWPDDEWAVLAEKSRWALEQGLDTLDLGTAMARLGQTFVGTAYVPHTLEVEGPERLVIGFRGLDCVTFVENVLAMSQFVRGRDVRELLEQRGEAEARYAELLTRIRYRGGKIDGYPSRLHYFTDWIADAEAKGFARDVTRDFDAVRQAGPINFMSTHPAAYRQLGDPGVLDRIRDSELRLSAAERWYVPQDVLLSVVGGLHEGDIIAATSTVAGLDVAHTGLVILVDGRPHLLHAPLVGEAVQISEQPLADRLLQIRGQDGVLVARPVER